MLLLNRFIIAFLLFVGVAHAKVISPDTSQPQSLIGWRLPATIVLSGPFVGSKALDLLAPTLQVVPLSAFWSEWGDKFNKDEKPSELMNAIVSTLYALDGGRVEATEKDVFITGTVDDSRLLKLMETITITFKEYNTHVQISPTSAAPLQWGAYRSSRSIELFGFVRSESERLRLVQEALDLFDGAAVIDKMKAGGQLSGKSLEAAEVLLAQLKTVNAGFVGIFGDHFDVVAEYFATGEKRAESQPDNTALCRSFMDLVPKGFKCGAIDVKQTIVAGFASEGIPYEPVFVPVLPAEPNKDSSTKIVDPRSVDVLFATTRQPEKSNVRKADIARFSGERDKLSFGQARVRIPDDHKIGRIELPGGFSIFGITFYEEEQNPKKHFILRSVEQLNLQQWNARVDEKGASEAIVFIHGFNTSFEQSIFRLAQIVWDLDYHGLPVLFSWASRGKVVDYLYDRESALNDRTAFLQLLTNLKKEHKISTIHIIAHSMGNFLVLDALAHLQRSQLSLGELIMAAPDVDRFQFEKDIAEVKPYFRGLTLYASSNDKALKLSKAAAGDILRAGDVSEDGPIVLPGLESVDVSALGDELFGLNHSMFAESRPLMNDIKLLMTEGRRAPRLIEVRPMPKDKPPPKYWQFQP